MAVGSEDRRSGILTRKVGMSRLFTEDGRHVPVTVLSVEGCQVVGHKTAERDGYVAVQVGSGSAKPARLTKPERQNFAKAGVEPKQKVIEFRVVEDLLIEVGAVFSADHFVEGQLVDVTGVSMGKGFAGAMKRHNFSGLRASHGVSVSHRSHGSTGNNQDPGKVFKGKKMAGHMGAVQVTTQNLKVVAVNSEQGLVFVEGAVPGHKGNWVTVRDAIKSRRPEAAPLPGAFKLKPLMVEAQESLEKTAEKGVSASPEDAGQTDSVSEG